MKLFLYILLIVLIFTGCSNDFLYRTSPGLFMMNDTIWIEQENSSQTFKLVLDDSIEDNTPFRVIYYPNYMTPENLEGLVKNGIAEISFYMGGNIISLINDGMQEGLLKIDAGNGKNYGFIIVIKEKGKSYTRMTMYQNELVFDHSNLATINFENATPKTINWSITKMPEWMYATQNQGTMGPRELGYITFTLSNGLVEGFDYTGEVVFETTNPAGKFIFPIVVKKWY
jgi:hypothetical protein